MGLPKITPYPLPTADDLPAARGQWVPETARAALLVHDMQRYFLAAFAQDDAPLAPAVANLARLLAHCRSRGIRAFGKIFSPMRCLGPTWFHCCEARPRPGLAR